MRSCNMRKIVPAIILATLAFCGCVKERIADCEDLALGLLSTRGIGGLSDDYRPVFIFYKAGDVATINRPPYPVPYCVADDVPEDANAYEVKYYNTQYVYPADFATLLATGYIPHDLVPVTDSEGTYYHRLTLSESCKGPGRVDLMAPETPLTGSLLNPFDKEGPLKFKHLQSKLSFRAICNNNFPTTMYVDNVIITIKNSDLAGGIVWNNSTYMTEAATSGDVKFGHGFEDLSGNTISVGVLHWYSGSLVAGGTDNNDYTNLGGVYVTPNRTGITVSVSCRMYPSSLLSEEEKNKYTKTADDLVVAFMDGNTPIELNEGDSYEITLLFEQDGLELSGRKAAWEQGGNIVIPVVPES